MQQDLRERLIVLGAGMMRHQGYTGVDVTKLCREAGVARAHFYRLIPGKQGLGLEVLSRLAQERFALLETSLQDEGSLEARLSRVFDALHEDQAVARAERGRAPGSVFAGFCDAVDEPEILRAVDEVMEGCRERLQTAIAAAIEAGEAERTEPSQAAKALVALIEGALQGVRAADEPDLLLAVKPSALALIGASASC